MRQRPIAPAAIGAEIDRIRSLNIETLRWRWRAVFGAIPPAGLTKDVIARMIAFRIQEQAFGGLDRVAVRLLDRLARGEKAGELNRRLKPGTVLIREYRGERHTVTTVPDGFLWQGRTYPSLSTIARAITGTVWNGPRFFGLRVASPNGSEVAADQPPEPVGPGARSRSPGRSSVPASHSNNDSGARHHGQVQSPTLRDLHTQIDRA